MNNRTMFLAAFLAGAAVGAAAVWQYASDKYARIAQEEIDSVKEAFSRRERRQKDETDANTKAENLQEPKKPDITEYAALLRKSGYTYSEEREKEAMRAAYVIPPEEFGEDEDYERISLTYYADKILADENDEMVEDVEESVSFESLNHFGEYEDDSVYVKNDARKCYYEILLDERNYSDIIKHMPHPVEVR